MTTIQVYTPTEGMNHNGKDTFYGVLQETINEAPKYDSKIIMGDVIAQIDSDQQGFLSGLAPWLSKQKQ